MGAVLATKGAAWGLAVGIILFFILHQKKQKVEQEPVPVAVSDGESARSSGGGCW